MPSTEEKTAFEKFEEIVDTHDHQIGGNHYMVHATQPWDIIEEYELDYFEGNALKYLLRRKENRKEDLQKARHYIEKCIERIHD